MKKLLIIALAFGLFACKKGGESTASTESATPATTETQPAETPKPAVTGPKPTPETIKMKPPFTIADSSKIVTTPSGLKYYIVHLGEGNVPQVGQKITAHYHGMLKDGKVFDSSYNRNDPFSTEVGIGKVIKGWDEAFTTLPVGTKAILIIPPEIGYGKQGQGSIPPDATLYFHIELININ